MLGVGAERRGCKEVACSLRRMVRCCMDIGLMVKGMARGSMRVGGGG